MIVNLKLAALATGAAGAIAAGGFAYAAVGSNSPAPSAKPVADTAKEVAKRAGGALPSAAPTCVTVPQAKLPNGKLPKGELPKGELPETKLPKGKLPKGEVPKAELPKAQLPESKLPTDKLPKSGELPQAAEKGKTAAKPNLPLPTDKAKAPSTLPAGAVKAPSGKAPATLPTCAPGQVQAAQSAPKPAVPSVPVAKPGLPKAQVPEAKLPSCDSVPAVIKTERSKAKDVTLPTGLHLAAAHSHSITIQSGKICAVAQKFTAAGGKYLTVERLNVPAQVTVKELAADLKLPEGDVVSAGGIQTWQSPLSTGMLWISDKGYAIYLTGSPAYSAQLPAIATQLRRLH
ncbi:hypothetical protein NE235_29895 [Actinoallomurus spadix]|uniref:Uncharacterized protein n=1 Tax=Actinoallomurus spadix TaxID=79912 RepID=A0ABP3G412_9ACTN|nr:hypothetical protein [Actinoallomurus spadix]MCO5990332.1 hypothetical protein [Actinoallomurus spadix]